MGKGRENQKWPLGPLVVISESSGQGKASCFPWWPEGLNTSGKHRGEVRTTWLDNKGGFRLHQQLCGVARGLLSSRMGSTAPHFLVVLEQTWKRVQQDSLSEQPRRPKAVDCYSKKTQNSGLRRMSRAM